MDKEEVVELLVVVVEVESFRRPGEGPRRRADAVSRAEAISSGVYVGVVCCAVCRVVVQGFLFSLIKLIIKS